MKIAITGASGPFGSATARGLIDRGVRPDNLILVSRNPERLSAFAELGATVRFGDFDDRASLEEALQGAQRMLMISTNRVGQREPQHTNAVEAAKKAGVKHVIYTSFMSKRNCASIAVADHRFTEDLLQRSGMAWTFLRNSQYSEAMRDAAGPAALRSGDWVSATGDGRIALVTRDDCIAAAIAVMAGTGHEGKIYEITGPELLTYREIAQMLTDITGREIDFRHVNAEGMYAFFDSLGIPRTAKDDHVVDGFAWCSDDMVSFDLTIAAGDFAILSDDFEKLTGRPPQSMRTFLERDREQLIAIAQDAEA